MTSAGEPGAPVRDPALLEGLVKSFDPGGAELVAELLTTFLDTAAASLADLRRAFGEGDAATVHRTAHSLKSNGATFGATNFTDHCRQLEAGAKGGDLAGLGPLVDALEADYAVLGPDLARTSRELMAAAGGAGG